jgi:hypothetical protein
VSRARALVHPGGGTPAPPSPALPLANPLFATGLLAQGWQDRALDPPHDMLLFVATGDPQDDDYIDVATVRAWSRRLAGRDVRVDAIGCPGARHAIDNEAWPIGGDVLAATVGYLDGVLSGQPAPVSLSACQQYEAAFLDARTPQ